MMSSISSDQHLSARGALAHLSKAHTLDKSMFRIFCSTGVVQLLFELVEHLKRKKSKFTRHTPFISRCLETSGGNILNQYCKYMCVIHSNINTVFDLWVIVGQLGTGKLFNATVGQLGTGKK